MTDFKEQCICIKFSFQIGKIGAETFQMLTFAFREEAMMQTVVFDCSGESRNGMTSVKDAEYSGCLPLPMGECTEMCNIFMGFGMKVDVLLYRSWLMSYAALWFMPSNFDTRLNL